MAFITIEKEEDYSWEIKYDEMGNPYYYNRFSDRALKSRPTCLENNNSGRVSIREPVIEAQYRDLWYKGILLGPADRVQFTVQLEQAPVQLLNVDRNLIRKWGASRRHTVPSSAQRGSNELSKNLDTHDIKELFEETASLSKLSLSDDGDEKYDEKSEKYDFEVSQSNSKARHFRNGKASGSLTVSSDSKARSRSWGCAGKRDLSSTGCSWTQDECEEDIGRLDMEPLKANLQGEGVRRSKRLNAVLLDLHDLSTIKRAANPSSDF